MKKKNKRSPLASIFTFVGTLILIVLIAVCIPFTVPKLMGYQAYTVISGSMEPEIPVGSLVYVESVEPREVEEKDVIAFYGGSDSNAIITHRVLENRVIMGEFITKGDANQEADMNPVEYSDYIGRVEKSIPKIGAFAQIMTSMEGKASAACLIGVAVILHVVAGMLRKR